MSDRLPICEMCRNFPGEHNFCPITAEELYEELRILMSDIDLGSRSYCDSVSMYKMEMTNINRNIRKCKQLVSKLRQLTEGENK